MRHRHKGFTIENGNRNILFDETENDIPTINWVQGNKIKLAMRGRIGSPYALIVTQNVIIEEFALKKKKRKILFLKEYRKNKRRR